MGSIRQRGSKQSHPESALVIRDYARFRELGRQFAQGGIKALIVISGPGKGKSQIMRQALEAVRPTSEDQLLNALKISVENILARLAPGSPQQPEPPNLSPGLCIKGDCRPIKFHIKAYQHRDAPILIDDADAFLAKLDNREKVKHLAETDRYKLMSHESFAPQLTKQGIPNEFYTTSLVCILRNAWDSNDHINQAIEDRGLVVYFDPTWDEVYRYIGEWFWDQEVYDYLLERMPLLREPSIRPLAKAYELKLARSTIFDWRTMIDAHTADKSLLMVSDFIRAQYNSEAERIAAWIKAVKSIDPNAPASKATWHRYLDELDEVTRNGQRPQRIILTNTEPPQQTRPDDGPIPGVATDDDIEIEDDLDLEDDDEE
jgi:hypothetical protein